MMRLMAGVALVLACLSACGESEDREPSPIPPLAVVFETDFIDIYGAVLVRVEDREAAFVLTGDGPAHDCDRPAFHLDGSGPFRFQAWSEKGYRWETTISNEGQGCQVVGIDTDSMVSTLAGVHIPGATYEACLPFEARSGAVEGRISSLWDYRPLIEQSGFEVADFRDYVLEAARAEKAIVIAAEPFEEAYFEFRSAHDDCDFAHSVFVPDMGFPVAMEPAAIFGEWDD